ncbi:MAG: hypothetical protein EXS32_14420 [Opitutus sp.]|nr:hypothetical protein [Opitutus sp.]
MLFGTLKQLDPDLVGFQEVLADQHDAIVTQMPGDARNDGRRAGEWATVGYRTARLIELAHGDFRLSETSEVLGRKSWDSALTRIGAGVRLRGRTNGREFIYANTHFDHVGTVARQEASNLVARRVAVLAAGAPARLTGDLDLSEDTSACTVLVHPEAADAIRWIDAYRTVHPQRGPTKRTGMRSRAQ